jgi:hypothetical protein
VQIWKTFQSLCAQIRWFSASTCGNVLNSNCVRFFCGIYLLRLTKEEMWARRKVESLHHQEDSYTLKLVRALVPMWQKCLNTFFKKLSRTHDAQAWNLFNSTQHSEK